MAESPNKIRGAWSRWRENRRQYVIDRALYKAENPQNPNVQVDTKGNPRVEPPPGINLPGGP
jgi:hypothetical protein